MLKSEFVDGVKFKTTENTVYTYRNSIVVDEDGNFVCYLELRNNGVRLFLNVVSLPFSRTFNFDQFNKV